MGILRNGNIFENGCGRCLRNIELSFEKYCVELFLRKDIVMICFKSSCLGCDFEPCLKGIVLTL
jgi:hypothetical protein